MPCHVSYRNTDGSIKCQFETDYGIYNESNLIKFDGEHWCLLHLPYENKMGEKNKEKGAKNQDFYDDLKKIELAALNAKQASVNLSYVVFGEDLDLAIFDKTNFYHSMRGINFNNAEFRGFIKSAEKISYTGELSFSYARFYSNVFFVESDFWNIRFDNTIFYEITSFASSKYKYACFNNAEFKLKAIFSRATFYNAIFDNSYFHGSALFENANFGSKISFKNVKFNGLADFSYIDNPEIKGFNPNIDEIDFSNSNFKDLKFTNRKFLSKTNFSSCIFNKPPQFHECIIHQDTQFPPEKNFKDISSHDAVHAYRTLYIAMSGLRARDEESMFFALLQKSARKSSKLSNWDAFISWLYEMTTNYGTDIVRPIRCLFLLIVFASLIYMYLSTSISYGHVDLANVGHSIDYSIKQIVRPFSFYNDYNNPFINQAMKQHPILFRLTAILETIFSWSCIAVFLLALRWKFKRD